jgi:hypothetical protein
MEKRQGRGGGGGNLGATGRPATGEDNTPPVQQCDLSTSVTIRLLPMQHLPMQHLHHIRR